MVHGYGDLVLRPATGNLTWKQRLIPWLFLGVLIVPAAVIVAVATGLLGVLIASAPFVVGALLVWGSRRCSRIIVTPHEIAVLGLIIRRRRQRARAVRVVRAHVVPSRGPVSDTVFVLDAAGKTVIRIWGHNYHRADIDRLVGFLGLPWSGPEQPVTANQLSTMYPGLVSWPEAHPFLLGLVGALVAVVGSGVIAIVLTLSM
jgi:hypothetical protein